MSPGKNVISVNVRIVCLSTPPEQCEGRETVFGVQDKSQKLLAGQRRSDGALQFDFSLKAQKSAGMERPNWTGPYAHGTRQQRFLYLSQALQEDEGLLWVRRIKVPLTGITWEQIDAAARRTLEASVDGSRTGMVTLLGDGWRVI
jgi:uncharacterized protein DUF5990